MIFCTSQATVSCSPTVDKTAREIAKTAIDDGARLAVG
jgi:hypothetical protein